MANLNLVPSITPEALAEIAAAGVDLKAINRANVIKKSPTFPAPTFT